MRYNPKDDDDHGRNVFRWKNTEHFYSKNQMLIEDARLRYPEKKYKNIQGEAMIWQAPEVNHRDSIHDIQVNDNIFAEFVDIGWRRSKVVDSKLSRNNLLQIGVKDVVDGNIRTVYCWKEKHKDQISFVDARDAYDLNWK